MSYDSVDLQAAAIFFHDFETLKFAGEMSNSDY